MPPGDITADYKTAVHEAGHAIAGILYRALPSIVELGLRGHADGRVGEGGVASAPPDDDRIAREGPRAAWPHLVIRFCGAAAERRVSSEEGDIALGSRSDELEAHRLAALACRSPEHAGRRDALIQAAGEAAALLVAEFDDLIQVIANELVLRRRIHGEELWDLISARSPSALRMPKPVPSDIPRC